VHLLLRHSRESQTHIVTRCRRLTVSYVAVSLRKPTRKSPASVGGAVVCLVFGNATRRDKGRYC
jgi:hypothetical protein